MADEVLDMDRFQNLGIVKSDLSFDEKKLSYFLNEIETIKKKSRIEKKEILNLFQVLIPDFDHKETGKYLDSKM